MAPTLPPSGICLGQQVYSQVVYLKYLWCQRLLLVHSHKLLTPVANLFVLRISPLWTSSSRKQNHITWGLRFAKKLKASFHIYFLIINQFYLKSKRGIDISADQGKWIWLGKRLYIIVPEGLAFQTIIKEMDEVGFLKRFQLPVFPESDKEKRGGYFYFFLEPH